MKRSYHTIDKQGKVGERRLAQFLVRNGQALLPMLELIEQSRMALDELIDVMGRASIEAVLQLSAVQVAGPPQQGKARQPDVVWHGRQSGRVCLKERQLRVNKPRLRRKGRGAGKEVLIPVYQALQQDTATGERMLEILLHGVSTRRYQRVIPEMADTVGVSRSTVSREAIEASEAALKRLLERRFDDLETSDVTPFFISDRFQNLPYLLEKDGIVALLIPTDISGNPFRLIAAEEGSRNFRILTRELKCELAYSNSVVLAELSGRSENSPIFG